MKTRRERERERENEDRQRDMRTKRVTGRSNEEGEWKYNNGSTKSRDNCRDEDDGKQYSGNNVHDYIV